MLGHTIAAGQRGGLPAVSCRSLVAVRACAYGSPRGGRRCHLPRK